MRENKVSTSLGWSEAHKGIIKNSEREALYLAREIEMLCWLLCESLGHSHDPVLAYIYLQAAIDKFMA